MVNLSPKPVQGTRMVKADIECDRLFDVPLNDAADYLQELALKYPKGTLTEEWSGYEDNYFEIQFSRPESNSEFNDRLEIWLTECNHKRVAADHLEHNLRIKAEIANLQKRIR